MAERTSRPAPATARKGVRAVDMSAIDSGAVLGVRLAIALVALVVTAHASPALAATCAVGAPGCCGADPDCDDGDPCNGAEICEVVTGTCMPGLPVDGIACNDGDLCTIADTCQGGVCVGTPVDARCDTGECFLAQCTPRRPGGRRRGLYQGAGR